MLTIIVFICWGITFVSFIAAMVLSIGNWGNYD